MAPEFGRMSRRGNGEGSIHPHRNVFAACAWATRPDGTRQRKYVYGCTREVVHDHWLALHQQAGPVVTRVPALGDYLARWVEEVVTPNLTPATAANYAVFSRLHIGPVLVTQTIRLGP